MSKLRANSNDVKLVKDICVRRFCSIMNATRDRWLRRGSREVLSTARYGTRVELYAQPRALDRHGSPKLV